MLKNRDDTITYYADVPLGLYVIRGDSMVLCGSVDDLLSGSTMKEVSLDQLDAQQQGEAEPQLPWDFDTDLIA